MDIENKKKMGEYYQKNREELLVKRKKYYQDNREEILKKQKEYNSKNREKINKRQRIYRVKYREDNKEILLVKQNIYTNTERGFMIALWNAIKSSSKKYKRINKFKDFDEFYNHWLEQKSRYGRKCPATGVEMTTIRGENKPGEHKTVKTNISADRILSTGDYSPENLIFTTWKYNSAKSNITPNMAKAFLTIVKERYGTEDIE
jgi:hypothetical protein